MVKIDGNIDLVFRNGLNNLEVLPPADVWENIVPQVAKPASRGGSFRAVAGVAALVSLGMLSYFIGVRTTESVLEPITANNTSPVPAELQIVESISEVPITAQAVFFDETDQPFANNTTRTLDTPSKLLTSANYNLLSSQQNGAGLSTSKDIVTPESVKTNASFVSLNSTQSSELLLPVAGSEKVQASNRWMVGAKISPTYLSSNLKAANNDIGSGSDAESGVISYTGGVSLKYAMGGRFSLQTGLFYSSLGRQISGINSYSGFAGLSESKGGKVFGVETSAGEISSTNQDIFLSDASGDRISSIYSIDNFDPVKANLNPYGSSLRQTFEYLEVPLILSYKLIDRKLDFNISGGMAYNFLLGNSTYAVSEGSRIEIGTTEEVTQLLLSSALGMSMEYSLNEKFSFNLEPTFRYFLNSEGRISSNNPFTFGLFSGFYYKF